MVRAAAFESCWEMMARQREWKRPGLGWKGKGPMASLERLASPLSKLVGFRPSFPMADLDVVETRPVNAFGYWTFIHARNR